jgi:hypothetical protein
LQTPLFAALVLLYWRSFASAQQPQQRASSKIEVGFPDKSWEFQFDGTGFKVKTNGV